MSSNFSPYLIRAYYTWIIDNAYTPYVVADASVPSLHVLQQYVEDGRIVLDISSEAVRKLNISNDELEFDARFSGVVRHITIPIDKILAIYAKETGEGGVFSGEVKGVGRKPMDKKPPESKPEEAQKRPKKPRKPDLKIVK